MRGLEVDAAFGVLWVCVIVFGICDISVALIGTDSSGCDEAIGNGCDFRRVVMCDARDGAVALKGDIDGFAVGIDGIGGGVFAEIDIILFDFEIVETDSGDRVVPGVDDVRVIAKDREIGGPQADVVERCDGIERQGGFEVRI